MVLQMCGNLRAGSVGWNHLHVGSVNSLSLSLGANRRWRRGDGRQSTVCPTRWQDGHMLSACLPPHCLAAACPSTWLLHQYNNELDIEGLLSAGESWPLMPRFGHLYTGTATMCHRHILWTALRTDIIRLRFSGITWDYERAIIVTYSI